MSGAFSVIRAPRVTSSARRDDARPGPEESRSLSRLTLCPDTPVMALDDASHRHQPDPGPLELLARVETRKGAKQPIGLRHVEADAVVPDEKDGLVVDRFASHLDARLLLVGSVFPGIGKQVRHGDVQEPRIPGHDQAGFHLALNGAPGVRASKLVQDPPGQL